MAGAIQRVPAIADAGVTRMINGPEAFTPDNEFILGESEVRGFFVAAGFCAHGIAGAGGIGREMARWIVDGEPGLDLERDPAVAARPLVVDGAQEVAGVGSAAERVRHHLTRRERDCREHLAAELAHEERALGQAPVAEARDHAQAPVIGGGGAPHEYGLRQFGRLHARALKPLELPV